MARGPSLIERYRFFMMARTLRQILLQSSLNTAGEDAEGGGLFQLS